MRKVLRFIGAVFSLCFMAFVILCTYSPVQPSGPLFFTGADAAESAEPTPAAATKEPSFLSSVPKVTLTAGVYPEDTQELTAQLYPGETALLGQFTQLKRADLSGSHNVEEIAAWAAANPEIEVIYTVTLPNGMTVSNSTTALDLSWLMAENAEQTIRQLKLLPKLRTLELGTVGAGGLTLSELASLSAALPEAELNYQLMLLGQTLSADTESVDLSAASQEEFAAALQVLGGLPKLKTVRLGAEGGNISWENIWQLNEVCPGAVYDFSYSLWGVATNLNAESVNLSHVKMDDQGAAVRNVMPLMHACTCVDMDTCGVSNDSMREMRDAFPNTKFVWRIWFGTNYSVRTDVEKILASKPSEGGKITNKDVDALSCCTDLKYMDIGHNEDLTDCSFFRSMPKLEVVILALTGISDLSPLADCPHLEYAELNNNWNISDLSPLANATELRHLNIGNNAVSDISCLYGLTELERLFLSSDTRVPKEQIEEMQRRAPDCYINCEQSDSSQGRWRYLDKLSDASWENWVKTGYFIYEYEPRYELLREQFGYDNLEYSFSWLDPLY